MPISTSRDSRYAAWVDVLASGDLPDRLALVAPLDRPAFLVRGEPRFRERGAQQSENA